MPKSLRIYFKHSRKVLLKRSDKLRVNSHMNEPMILERLLKYIPNLRSAYELKEALLHIVKETHPPEKARQLLNHWIQLAKGSHIKEFEPCIRAYQNWKEPILNAFTLPYSNGVTECCNNKIKVIKRNAFGLKNFDRFCTRILLNFA